MRRSICAMNKLQHSLNRLGITRGDIFLAASLLLFSAALGIIIAFTRPEPEYVTITVDGTEICRLPLDEDGTYSIGEGNTIQISDGSVRMIYADCPDKICVKTGSISHSGQSIVCAPHKIVVTITGGNSSVYDTHTN